MIYKYIIKYKGCSLGKLASKVALLINRCFSINKIICKIVILGLNEYKSDYYYNYCYYTGYPGGLKFKKILSLYNSFLKIIKNMLSNFHLKHHFYNNIKFYDR